MLINNNPAGVNHGTAHYGNEQADYLAKETAITPLKL